MTTIERNVQAPADGGAKPTRRQNAEKGFTASKELTENLQRVHVDLIELHLQGKQAHWNVVGKNFRDLHLQLDEIVEEVREFSDTVAARTRLAEFPAAEVNTSETVDLIGSALYAVAGTARRIHDDVDAEDPTTADLLHAILLRLEQLAWMIDAENRVANKTEPLPIHE